MAGVMKQGVSLSVNKGQGKEPEVYGLWHLKNNRK